jgi:hypothetical protein
MAFTYASLSLHLRQVSVPADSRLELCGNRNAMLTASLLFKDCKSMDSGSGLQNPNSRNHLVGGNTNKGTEFLMILRSSVFIVQVHK